MLNLPERYEPTLDIHRREIASKEIKDFFERELAAALGFHRVTAPLFVHRGTGINDDLPSYRTGQTIHGSGGWSV